MYFLSTSGVELGVSLWVDIEVPLLVDVGTSPGLTVLLPVVNVPPADVSVDVSTWVVSVFPSTVQMYMQLVCFCVHAKYVDYYSIYTRGDCTQC